jgi:WD40 repeat protein
MIITRVTSTLVFLLALVLFTPIVRAQPPAEKEPLLRLEADGPTSFVTALAFDPQGETLYAAGYDKVVRVWTWDQKTKSFVLNRAATYRVPIGPELQGAINALAVSPDGNWLAAAGSGVVRKSAGFGVGGMIVPGRPRDDDMLLDEGRIYVYNTKTRNLTVLRGHKGMVLSMAFASSRADQPPTLVSSALEYDREPKAGIGSLRVWNVETGKELAAGTGQPNRDTRVGMAAWYTDAKPAELRVAYAWGDGILRVWDVSAGRLHDSTHDGLDGAKLDTQRTLNHNITVAWSDQRKTLTTGSLSEDGSRIRSWSIAPGKAPNAEEPPIRVFPVSKETRDMPRAMSLLSSKGNGQLDFTAVILRTDRTKGPESYSLRLIGLSGAGEAANIPLWEGGASLPVVVAAPNGKFLAVAGNDQHEIRLYNTADLFKDKKPVYQPLRSVGEEFLSAGFVRRGPDQLGLVLKVKADGRLISPPREPVPGELVFDFASRRLQTTTIFVPSPDPWSSVVAAVSFAKARWQADGPDLSDADVKLARNENGNDVITVRIGRDSKQITLGAKQRVTKCALLPVLAPPTAIKIPILAVAFTEGGLPRLYLYNASTGEQIRQYSGHTDPIRSLAFSSDGKLLVSAAEDQTVCVWSLTNLDRIVGHHGLLPGVAVKEGKGGVEVFDISDDSPARGKLAKGDIIEQIVDEKKAVKAIASPGTFYDAVFMLKPNETVTLRRVGKPAIELKVGQSIDERKPLFSLFVKRGTAQAWDWVGWNPVGFYESSSAAVENFIGWQINNADNPEKPSSFAGAPEYRKRFYREGILRLLATRGNLPAALKDWDAADRAKAGPSPKLLLYVRETNPVPDANGEIVVKQAPLTLVVDVDDVDPDRINWVRYRVEGEEGGLKELVAENDRSWSADLKRLLNKPGLYKVHARVRTKEAEPREWEKELLVRCGQDAPDEDRSALPSVVLHKPDNGLTIYDDGKGPPELEVQGALTPAVTPRDCKAFLLRNGEAIGDARIVDAKATSFSRQLKLVPGLNRIQVRFETDKGASITSEAIQVRFLRPPRALGFENNAALEAKPSEKALVDLSALMQSDLSLKKEFVRAQINARDFGADGISIEDLKAASWRVRLKNVPLDEGANEIRIWAGNDEGECRMAGALKLEYKPPKAVSPPVVEVIDPAKDTVVTEGELELRARITSPDLLTSVTLVREGNSPFSRQIPIDNKSRDNRGVLEVKVSVALAAGGNRLRLEAINEGGKSEDALVVTFLKKPVRLQIEYLVPKGTNDEKDRIKPKLLRNGKLYFKGAPRDECVVRGWVNWDQEKDDQLRGSHAVVVRAYVNGKRQRPVLLTPAASTERRRAFDVNVLLTEAENNVLEIELPELAQEASNPSEFYADCRKPNSKQYGHLLIVGTGKTKENTLIQNALRAIQGEELTNAEKGLREFKAAAFERGRIYPPLTGANITPDKVLTWLRYIRLEIDRRAGDGSANDVMLVYYEGNEAVTAEGHFLRTDRSRYEDDLNTSALTVSRLENYCSDMMGSQVLLLDVSRDDSIRAAAYDEDKDAVAKRPGRSYVSVFRCVSLLDHLDAPSNPILLASLQEATKSRARLGEVGKDVAERIKAPLHTEAIPKSQVVLPVGAGPGG